MARKYFALAVCLTACGGEPGSDVGELSNAVVNGSLSSDDSVVAILDAETGDLCSGTLIHPRLVLTAKHCVQDPGGSAPLAPEQLLVVTGNALGKISSDRVLPIQAIGTHPGAYQADGSGLAGNDVAILVLSQAAVGATREVREDSAGDQIGKSVTVVGFGLTPSGGNGVKLEASTVVEGLDGQVLVTGPSICKGDSGGPMIESDGRVIGVASIGTKICGSGQRGFNSLDGEKPLLQAALEMACPTAETEGCQKLDPAGAGSAGNAGSEDLPLAAPSSNGSSSGCSMKQPRTDTSSLGWLALIALGVARRQRRGILPPCSPPGTRTSPATSRKPQSS